MMEKIAVFPAGKRIFDLLIVFATAPIWIPTLMVCALATLIFEGRPVFYASPRRVHGDKVITVYKFRTMRRNADTQYNRDTVPISGKCFLNISPESPLYTATGRIIERCMLTEIPQLWHVILGQMSLVGNRPLPVNVVEALREMHPDVDVRFLAPTGLTGPVQLVGRDFISDTDRLALEAAYVTKVSQSQSVLLDIKILTLTVAAGLSPRWRLTLDQVFELIEQHEQREPTPADQPDERTPTEPIRGNPNAER